MLILGSVQASVGAKSVQRCASGNGISIRMWYAAVVHAEQLIQVCLDTEQLDFRCGVAC